MQRLSGIVLVLLAFLLHLGFNRTICCGQLLDSQLVRSVSAPQPTGPPASSSADQLPIQTGKSAANPKGVEAGMDLKDPPLETTDVPLPINLAAALKLADARPLMVTYAQARVWVAEAQLQHAQLLLVPQLNLSAVFYRHDGVGPDFFRGNNGGNPPGHFDINSVSVPIRQNFNWFQAGAGLYGVGNLTDAIFVPLAVRQVLKSRQADVQTARNDALLETARAYFTVHEYRGRYAGALDCVERAGKLIERLTEMSKDLIPRIEIDRAKRLQADLQQRAASAREAWRVASADLTLVLRLDPRAVVVPLEHDHMQITLVDPGRSLDELIPISQFYRPELAAQQAQVQAAMVRIRQEKLRPILPFFVIAGFQTPGDMRNQFTIFGTGPGANLNNWSLREDVSGGLYWQLDALGFGNLALIKQQRGVESQAIRDLFRMQDLIAEQVTRSQANLQSAAVRVGQAERTLREALITYEGNYEGLRQTKRLEQVLVQVYRPQEVVAALTNLRDSYDQYFTSVADYNRAQFELYHALGYPAAEIECNQPPGEPLQVETTRPGYLPPVGVGPPPATR